MTVFNLNLDDYLPPFDRFGLLERLVRELPGVRVTVFLPVNSRDFGVGKCDVRKHLAWTRRLGTLPPANFEFAYHGFQHHLPGGKPEFADLDTDEADALLARCERVFAKLGVDMVKGFRPPRWEASEGTVRALNRRGYAFLAGTPRFAGQYAGFQGPVPYFNRDIHAGTRTGDIKPFLETGLLPDAREAVVMRGHLAGRLKNVLDARTLQNVVREARALGPGVEYRFLSEIAAEAGG